MVTRSLSLRIQLEFEDETQIKEALDNFLVVTKNWENAYKQNPKNTIKYFTQEINDVVE